MEVTPAQDRKIPPMKPATLLLWIVVAVGTQLLANFSDFGQYGARAANPQDQVRDIPLDPVQKPSSQPPPPRKAKSQSSTPGFDPPFQIATNYFGHEGIGVRWSQHFYDNPLDLGFKDGLQHLEESKARRLKNIQEQVKALYKPDEIEAFPEFRANVSSPIYLSHVYYKTKWDTIDQETQALASAQNGYVNAEDGTCGGPVTEVSDDMDLSKKRILSNRVKMGLAELGSKEEQKNLRQSGIMSLAFGWLPSCELPIERIERNENEQIIEMTFSKMAKTHHIQNYGKFVDIFSAQEMSGSRNIFSRSFYTVDHGNNHPVAKLGGIIEGVHAKDISNLTKSKSPRAATFFGQRIEIQPNFINFNQVQILRPEQMKFTIENIDAENDVIINDVFTSTPELLIYPPKGVRFPATLKAGQTMTFTCLIATETWGLIQGSVSVAFDSEFIFMLPVTAFSISNEYEIEPVYYSNVNVGEQVQGFLKLKNPSATEELDIIELYSTEDYLKLFWPNQVQVASPSEAQSNRDFSKYLRIEPGAKSKTILTYKFETDQAVDHRVVIHMLTSRGDVLRIPFYFHVYTDILKFTPSIVDFGLVPFRFDLLKIPVSVAIRNGVDFNVLYLSEVLLPLTDKRLDFVIGAWDRDNYGNIQVINKNTRRLEEQRRGVLQRDKNLHLFTIILNPIAFGPVDTYVVLVFNTDDGSEFRIDLPIIGHVLPTSNLLTENGQKSGNHFQPWSIAKPAITIDVSHQLNDPALKSPQLLKSKRVEERLILANTLGTPLKGLEVINTFPYAIFTYFSGSSSRQQGSSKSGVITPGQTIQLGAFILNIKDLQTTSGRYYSFVHVNSNLFLPIAIQVTDNRLLCSYQPEDYQVTLYRDCQSGISLDFGNLVPYQSKQKIVNMTNIGSEAIQIDWLTRTTSEVQVRFLRYSPPLTSGSSSIGSIGEWSSEELRQRLSIWIQPQQTLTIQITAEPTQRTLMGLTEMVSKQLLSFQFIPRAFSEFNVSVSFKAHDGMIQFLPKNRVMIFAPAFVGQEKHEHQILSFKSNLKKDVLVKSFSVDDPRFKVTITNTKLNNQTEVLKVVFDPNQKPVAASVAVGVKNATDLSKVLQRVTNQDPTASTKPESSSTTDSLHIALKDITKLRQTQETLFKNRKVSESKLITATLTVETDFVSPLHFKLRGEVVPAEIINTTKIDFGKVAIGSSSSAPLLIQNVFNETMKVQIFVGRTTLSIENELRRLKLLSIIEDPILNESLEEDRPKYKFAEKLLRELPYADFYCFRVFSISENNKVLAQSTLSSSRQWQLDEDWLNEYEDAIFLDRESPKDLVCAGMVKVLSGYSSINEFQVDSGMWQSIDKFFKELLVANMPLQTGPNAESASYDQLTNIGITSQIESLLDQLVKGNELTASLDQRPEPVDQEILNDMIFCSAQQPLLEVNQTDLMHLIQKISFPNVIDYYLPVRPYVKSFIWFTSTPFRWTYQVLKTAYNQDGVANQISTVFSETFSGVFDFFSNSISSRKKMKSLRPEDFLLQRARDKNFQPAATITNQFQFTNDVLHERILRNNGTIGVERNVQNFYLNSKYQKTFNIAPLQYLYLSDVVIFEPQVLTENDEEPLQMSLYIKTDKTGLQKIDMVGQSSSTLLELTDIVKIIQDQKEGKKFLHQKSTDIPMFCGPKDEGHLNCLNSSAHNSLIVQQLVGRSTLTPLISLKLDLRDVLMSADSEMSLNLPNSFTWLLSLVNGAEPLTTFDKSPKLAESFDWLLTFANYGNANFNSLQIGFEDSTTGQISCQSGELFIEPCAELKVLPQKSQTIHLRLKADYSTAVYKKTLVFKSTGHIQRFPLHLYTESQILDLASRLKDVSYQKSFQSTLLVTLSLAVVSFYLSKSVQHRRSKLVASAATNTTIEPVISSNVPDQQTQEHQKVIQSAQETQIKKQQNQVTVEQQKTVSANKKAEKQAARINAKQSNMIVVETVEEEIKEVEQKIIEQPVEQEDKQEVVKIVDVPKSKKRNEVVPEPEITVIESKIETQYQNAYAVRMSKRERRAQEQRKREAEILTANLSEPDTQTSQSKAKSKVDGDSQENKTENNQITSTRIDQFPSQIIQSSQVTGIINEVIGDNDYDKIEVEKDVVDAQSDTVNSLNSDKPAQAAQTVKEVVSQVRLDSPRPQREQPKTKSVVEQVEFQVPQKLKRVEDQDPPKYKRVSESTKSNDEQTASELAKPKAAAVATHSYIASKPTKIYQRTVTSIERPLSAFTERRNPLPQTTNQEKPSVTAQAPQPIARTPQTRVVVDKSQENYFDRSQQSKQFSNAAPQKSSSYEKQEEPLHSDRKSQAQTSKYTYQERPRREEELWTDSKVQEPENNSYYARPQTGHAYHRNKHQNEVWQTSYDQEQEQYDHEYNEEYDTTNQQELQYKSYSKRPQWQQNHETTTPRTKSPSTSYAPSFQKIQATKPAYEKPLFVPKAYQPVQAVYQPKKLETVSKPIVEPVIEQFLPQPALQKIETVQATQKQQLQADMKQPVQSAFVQEDYEHKDEVKVNSFYNAFKSASSIFSMQKKKEVVADEDRVESVGYKELSSKRPVQNLGQSGFSIFSNSVFAKDTKASLSSQSAFEFQSHTQPQKTNVDPNAPAQRELSKPSENLSSEPVLTFRPLKQYSNVFSDSLNSLTNQSKLQQQDPAKTPETKKEEKSHYKFF